MLGARRLRLPLVSVVSVVSVTPLAAWGCLSASAAEHGAPRTHEVVMKSVAFAPAELVVAVGDTVLWRNADIVRHNAVRPNVFDSDELSPGSRYAWIPADTGSFTYRCTIHQRMRGKVTVVPRASEQ